MAKHAVHRAACFAFFMCLALSSCATRGPVLASRASELSDTPFFPQSKYQCGPAALATVLAASGVAVTPQELTPRVFVPARRGSLQVEMQAAPRAYRRLSLTLPRSLEAIVAELDAGRAVLVLHNYGVAFWPRWHYAVVVGYDPAHDVFLLRSGRRERQQMRTRHFMVYWQHAARWAMVVLRPGETAANADATLYLEAAADFERDASPEDSRAAFEAAVKRWPKAPVAWIGRGTAEYRLGNLAAAARDYAAAIALDPGQTAARNNLAQTLLDLRCPHRAQEQLNRIRIDDLRPPLKEAVLDTLENARVAAGVSADSQDCVGIL
jgi:tetratricopeptide (TPR) repeat protein